MKRPQNDIKCNWALKERPAGQTSSPSRRVCTVLPMLVYSLSKVPFQDKCRCEDSSHFEVQNTRDFKCITLLLKYIAAVQMEFSVQQQSA